MLEWIIFFFIGLVVLYWYISCPSNLPPGPIGIPILGYLPWLIYYNNDRVALSNALKKYGSIVSLRVGFNYMLFLNDLESMEAAFIGLKGVFAGRGMPIMNKIIDNGKGFTSNEGPNHLVHRRFVLHTLRNLGMGKKSFETPIIESICKLCEKLNRHIAEHADESIDMTHSVMNCMADNISTIIVGEHFKDNEIDTLVKMQGEISKVPPIFFLMNSFSFLQPIMYLNWAKDMLGVSKFLKIIATLKSVTNKYIQAHKSFHQAGDDSDFLFCCFTEQAKREHAGDELWDDDQLMTVVNDLIGAGIGATTNTLLAVILLIANDTAWQSRLHNEIDEVVGHGKFPEMSDLQNMPLTEATILEAARFAVISPTAIPHSTMDSCHLRGYFIPRKCAVIPNFYAIFREKSVWTDPHHFNPQKNMLNDDMSSVINRSHVPLFSLGLRSCVGESLARMELFMFITSLLQRYNLRIDPKYGFPEFGNGVFRVPVHGRILISRRY